MQTSGSGNTIRTPSLSSSIGIYYTGDYCPYLLALSPLIGVLLASTLLCGCLPLVGLDNPA
jgi:hypothetical protein